MEKGQNPRQKLLLLPRSERRDGCGPGPAAPWQRDGAALAAFTPRRREESGDARRLLPLGLGGGVCPWVQLFVELSAAFIGWLVRG